MRLQVELVEVSEREIEIFWTSAGEEKNAAFLCAELVNLLHYHFDLGHELLFCGYDSLGNYFARIEQDGIKKEVHLANYVRRQVLRKAEQLLPILEAIHSEMIIEDFVLV